MLRAISAAKLIVTDSGGLQEEAAWFGVPVIVMRYSTPRWEGVANGTTALAGVSRDKVLAAAVRMLDPESLQRAAATPCPYGSGDTGERIAAVLTGPEADALLVLEEPDYTDGSLPADLQ
jgi:UDP-N-acetylglucosamine 2-epimerase (non-hydrolysing)